MVENSTFKIILWILANRLSLTYGPSQQAKYLQEPGGKAQNVSRK